MQRPMLFKIAANRGPDGVWALLQECNRQLLEGGAMAQVIPPMLMKQLLVRLPACA